MGQIPSVSFFEKTAAIGETIVTDSDQTLTREKDPALFMNAWYEETGGFFMLAYDRLASAKISTQHYEPLLLTNFLTLEVYMKATEFLGKDMSRVSKTGPFHLHVILDGLFDLGSKRSMPHDSTKELTQSMLKGVTEFYQATTTPPSDYLITNKTAQSTLNENDLDHK